MAFGPFKGKSQSDIAQQQGAYGTEESQAAQQAAQDASWQLTNTYGDYYQSGGHHLGHNRYAPAGYDDSALRYDQSNQERTAEQVNNYQYGGYTDGANDAVAAARGAVGPYTAALGAYGSDAYGNSGFGTNMYAAGTGGLYDEANALNAYAQQGPGASVAQAQLQANAAQAMNEQLALAGSGRGQGGGASAFRQAAANQAQLRGQANAQAAMLQAQEAQNWRQAQLQAMGAAGQLYGQGAGLGSEYAQGMAGLGMQGQQAAGTLGLGGEQLANQIQGTALSGRQGYEQNLTSIYGIDKGVPVMGGDGMTTKDWLGLGLTAAATTAAVASDVRAKTNIQPTSSLQAISDIGQKPAQFELPPQQQFTLPPRPGEPTQEQKDREEQDANDQQQAGWLALADYGRALMGVGKNYGAPIGSDVKAKTNIEPSSALDAIGDAGSYSYNYLDPQRHGQGTYVGPMAQELEQAPGVVYKQSDGTKAIDPNRLTTLNTSAIAELNRKVDALSGQGTPSDFNPYTNMETAPAQKPHARPAAVDTSVAPKNAGVAQALHAFGGQAPSEAEIAAAREALRGKFGGASANEFERYAMALRGEKQRAPRVSIGPAQDVYTGADAADFQRRMANTYIPDEESPEAVRVPQRGRPVVQTPATGPTQPAVFTGDPATLDYLNGRYGASVYGAPGPAVPEQDEGPSYLDRVFGPNVGQQAADITEEEYRNQALRQLFRQPARVDTAL